MQKSIGESNKLKQTGHLRSSRDLFSSRVVDVSLWALREALREVWLDEWGVFLELHDQIRVANERAAEPDENTVLLGYVSDGEAIRGEAVVNGREYLGKH